LDDEEFLDRVYEAGAVPEFWPKVLGLFAELSGSAGGVLIAMRGEQFRWLASEQMREEAAAYFSSHYPGHDQRTIRLSATEHTGFVRDLDVFSPEEWEADPVRRDFWAPRGFGWGIATSIVAPSGDQIIFHGERRAEHGPHDRATVARLDRLRPHLARAALLSNRVAFERVSAAVAVLEVVGIPAAVVDRRGQALATNTLLDALNPAVVLARPSRLALSDRRADALLVQALDSLDSETGRVPRSIPIRAHEDHPPTVVHVHPVKGAARDIFTRAAAVLLFTPVVASAPPETAVIQGLFDLTPAEARVARALAGGGRVADIAAANETSTETVRSQVRAVFAKTGVNRQADLIGLLRGAARGGED
jgi:DNA-binding CsgD family transcriptional regulator